MNTIRRLAGRSSLLVTALAFTAAVVVPVLLPASQVGAAQLSSRTLTMTSTADGLTATDANGTAVAAGTPGNGAQTRHSFTYTHPAPASGNVGSVFLQYCTTPLFGTTCTAPTNMNAATITTIQAESGYAASDFALDTVTDATTATGAGFFAADTNACAGASPGRTNCILIRDTTTQQAISGPITLTFGTSGTDWIKNPETDGTFYVRITTFTDGAYTTVKDDGAVAGSVNEQIDITARVQEKLNFSVANNSTTVSDSTCAALNSGGNLTLGDSQGVLDPGTAYFNHSYFRLSTNASGGTTVQYSGDTLKTAGGTFSIDAINSGSGTAAASATGQEQFGLTLDSSQTLTGFGYSFTNLTRAANYNSDSAYAFATSALTTPVTLASVSAGNIVSCDTGAVKYVGNIAPTTNAGQYKTRITYFATPTF